MKVIVAGSRDWADKLKIWSTLDHLKGTLPITEVVCGMARGVDVLGAQWAAKNGVHVAEFPAHWQRPDGSQNKGAGYQRNAAMADYADILVAFWDGKSPGTKHMIELATKAGLPVYLHMGKPEPKASQEHKDTQQ